MSQHASKHLKIAELPAIRSTAHAPEVTPHFRQPDLVLALLSLQHEVGNQAVTRILASHNADEKEAERVEHQVMNHTPTEDTQALNLLSSAATLSASDLPVNQLGPGMPLLSALRTMFEGRLGYDLGQVRIHSGIQAALLAHALKAQAFTTGNTIVFGNGKYQPDTTAGKALLAHELTHVVQQSQTGVQSMQRKASDEDVENEPTPPVTSDGVLKELDQSVSAQPKQSPAQFLREMEKYEARGQIQDLLSAPSLDIDKAFDALRLSYDAEPLTIKHRVRLSDLAPRGVRGHVAGGETGKVGDIHPVHFLKDVILYHDETGQPQLLHYVAKASVQDFTDLALPTRGDFTGFDKARGLPGVVTSRAILQQLGEGEPGGDDRLVAGHRVLPLGTLGLVRFPGHAGVSVRNVEVGNFHTAGEVTTRTAREGGALVGVSGSKFDWDAGPPSVQYDMLLGTSAMRRQFTKEELSVTAIRANLETALRNRLQERLAQLPR